MIDDVDSSSSTLRLLVTEALRNWTTKALMALLLDDDVIVKTAAARELQARGDKVIYDEVIALSKQEKSASKEIAAFVLGQLGTPQMPFKDSSLPVLLLLTNDKDADVRSAAAAALGHLCYAGMPIDVEKRLVDLCVDENREVRACAAYALGNSSGNDVVRTALGNLSNEEYVSDFAKLGLEMIDDREVI